VGRYQGVRSVTKRSV